jgi:hypothetical protein
MSAANPADKANNKSTPIPVSQMNTLLETETKSRDDDDVSKDISDGVGNLKDVEMERESPNENRGPDIANDETCGNSINGSVPTSSDTRIDEDVVESAMNVEEGEFTFANDASSERSSADQDAAEVHDMKVNDKNHNPDASFEGESIMDVEQKQAEDADSETSGAGFSDTNDDVDRLSDSNRDEDDDGADSVASGASRGGLKEAEKALVATSSSSDRENASDDENASVSSSTSSNARVQPEATVTDSSTPLTETDDAPKSLGPGFAEDIASNPTNSVTPVIDLCSSDGEDSGSDEDKNIDSAACGKKREASTGDAGDFLYVDQAVTVLKGKANHPAKIVSLQGATAIVKWAWGGHDETVPIESIISIDTGFSGRRSRKKPEQLTYQLRKSPANKKPKHAANLKLKKNSSGALKAASVRTPSPCKSSNKGYGMKQRVQNEDASSTKNGFVVTPSPRKNTSVYPPTEVSGSSEVPGRGIFETL